MIQKKGCKSFLLVVLLITQSGLLVCGAWTNSPTLNEPAHLAAGIHHLETADFSLYAVNPPLVRVIAAMPVMIVGYHADWSMHFEGIGARPEFEIGKSFVAANGKRSWLLFCLGRLAVIPFTLLGTLICFCWARELSGLTVAGMVAALLWAFDPFTLGHGCLMTPDCHGAALGVAASYSFWRWLRMPSWRETFVSGIALGAALSTKTTLIILLPLWPILWLVDRGRQKNECSATKKEVTRQFWRELGMSTGRTVIALYILNLCYLGQGFGTRLGDYRFVSCLFAGTPDSENSAGKNSFRNSCVGWVPVPLPKQYLVGIDLQQRDFEQYATQSYARGHWSNTGWWWYYAYVLLVKEPVGTLAMMGFATGVWLLILRLNDRHIDERGSLVGENQPNTKVGDLFLVIAPASVIFAVVSSKNGFSEHGRYVLPCLPFIFVAVGTVLGMTSQRLTGKWKWAHQRLIVGLVVLTVFESLLAWPGSLAFFNLAAGGSQAGPKHLLGSNVDWGQDLKRVNQWVQRNANGRQVYLAYHEVMYDVWNLADDGLASWPLDLVSRSKTDPEIADIWNGGDDGYYAVAVGLLHGSCDSVRRRDNVLVVPDERLMRQLRAVEPLVRVGQTIRVFSAEQVRMAWLRR